MAKPEREKESAFERDYPWLDAEGDCSACDGTGEVICDCDDRGCSRCVDGLRTCGNCDGSGYDPDGIASTWEEE